MAVPAQAIAQQRAGRARIVSVAAPTGGWNTRDAPDLMEPTDALELTNFIPKIGKVTSRGGYTTFIDGIAADIGGAWAADNIETLFTLVHGTSEKFLAAMDGGIARIDTGTAIEVKVRATYTVDRWQWTTFTDSTAPNTPQIYAVNGTDAPWKYDGTTHANWTPTVTGATLADFIWIYSYKNRLYMGEKNSRNFWVSTTVGDDTAFTRFPLSGIRGAQGNVLFMAALTRDTGSGPDDFAVFVTTRGQAIVYQGDDPTDATAWSLVGVYQLPEPIPSYRAHVSLFGDIVIATNLDYIFLSAALQESGAVILNPSKLTGAIQDAAAKYEDNYGWELITSEVDNIVLSNIPLTTNTRYEQHVINVQTRAAAKFTGWHFRTYAVWNGRLYGAGNNTVYRLLSGRVDDGSDTETRIELRAQTAWSDLGTPENKHIRAIRLLTRSQGDWVFNAGIGTDFVDPTVAAVASTGPAGATTLWGDTAATTTLWGDTAATTTYWAGTTTAGSTSNREWRLLAGRGSDFSIKLSSNTKDQQVDWLSTDYKVDAVGRF